MGVDKTKGHVQGQQGLRGHSCGETFPFVLYSQGTFDNLNYWVLQPNGLRIGAFPTWEEAEAMALQLKRYGQLPRKAAPVAAPSEPVYFYYREAGSLGVDTWRWRHRVGAPPEGRGEVTSNSGATWSSSAMDVSELQDLTRFLFIGSDPQWPTL